MSRYPHCDPFSFLIFLSFLDFTYDTLLALLIYLAHGIDKKKRSPGISPFDAVKTCLLSCLLASTLVSLLLP